MFKFNKKILIIMLLGKSIFLHALQGPETIYGKCIFRQNSNKIIYLN